MAPHPPAEPSKVNKQKIKHKKKHKSKKEAEQTTSSADNADGHKNSAAAVPAKRKRDAATDSTDTSQNLTSKGATDTDLMHKHKKSKKHKRSRDRTDQEPSSQPSNGDAGRKAASLDGDKQKKKKKKKDKKDKGGSIDHSKSMAHGEASTPSASSDAVKGAKSYSMHDKTRGMTRDQVTAFRSEANITVEHRDRPKVDDAIYHPITEFSHANQAIPASILGFTDKFSKPSPIQAQCWPLVLSKLDVIGIAATGSGKTVAFGLPALTHVSELRDQGAASGLTTNTKRGRQPSVLVVAPTRELAGQIEKVLKEAGQATSPPISTLVVYGGVPKGPQRQQLRDGVDVLVATPGRLLDLMDEGVVRLDNISLCVLDEADRMLDMGFEKDIKRIMAATPRQRQTVMFSATWPDEVQSIAREYMRKPVHVTVGSKDLAANKNVTQTVEVVDPKDKNFKLLGLLRQYHRSSSNKILIFALYKKEAQRLEQYLAAKRYNVLALHGDLSQDQRGVVLNKFRSGEVPIMIATDVAARGLDVQDIEVVINYTFPLTIEDYVHRIGRTGRAGAQGHSFTLFTMHDKAHAGALGNVLREAGLEIPAELMKFGMHTKRKAHPIYGDHYRTTDDLVGKTSERIVFDDSDDDDE